MSWPQVLSRIYSYATKIQLETQSIETGLNNCLCQSGKNTKIHNFYILSIWLGIIKLENIKSYNLIFFCPPSKIDCTITKVQLLFPGHKMDHPLKPVILKERNIYISPQ